MGLPKFYGRIRPGSIGPSKVHLCEKEGKTRSSGLETYKSKAHETASEVLFCINPQVDFLMWEALSEGKFLCPTAVDDMDRLNRFIITRPSQLSRIIISCDAHYPDYIGFPSWWHNPSTGRNPLPGTVITARSLSNSIWVPISHVDWTYDYMQSLFGIYPEGLMIFPKHCVLGSVGAAMDPSFMEALLYYCSFTGNSYTLFHRGLQHDGERHSVLRKGLVPVDGHHCGYRHDTYASFAEATTVWVAGQLMSHCVIETLFDIMSSFSDCPEMRSKFCLLEDCGGSLKIHQGKDYAEDTVAAIEELKSMGMRTARAQDFIQQLQD